MKRWRGWAGAGLVGVVGLLWALRPAAPPPLRDAAGVAVPTQQAARWVEGVFAAARADDVAGVEAFLAARFEPNVRSGRGDTLLAVAAYHGSRRVLERLLEEPGVELEAVSRMGLTAISAAAFKGHRGCAIALLEAGADPNAGNFSQQTALMFAALAGHADVVAVLLEAGAEAEVRDREGRSARDVARIQGAERALEVLEGAAPRSDAPVPLELAGEP